MDEKNPPLDELGPALQDFQIKMVEAVQQIYTGLSYGLRPLVDMAFKMRTFQRLQEEYNPRYVLTEHNGELIQAFCLKVPEIDQEDIDGIIYYTANRIPQGQVGSNTIQAKIIAILVDQFNKNAGWVPHRTFMNACGWSEYEYFRNGSDPGRMNRQLSLIRKILPDVEIKFNVKHGVRIIEE